MSFEPAEYTFNETGGCVELILIFSEVIPFESYLKFEVKGSNGNIPGPSAKGKL